MFLVLGLGNPGARYVTTRHNVGFLVVDVLARRAGVSVDRAQLGALTAGCRMGQERVLLAKPQEFMNVSGASGRKLSDYYKVDRHHVVVVHDDLDVPFGQVVVKARGGHRGHNGLRDLHRHLGGDDYPRVRVGISRPPSGWDPANYVLGHWTPEESEQLEQLTGEAADAVEELVTNGVAVAEERYAAPRDARAPQLR